MKFLRVLCFAVAGLTYMAASAGAAEVFKSYGSIRPSDEAAAVFESHSVLPDYRYYVSGADLYPNALIALEKGHSLDSDLWKERKLKPEDMKEIVGNMQSKALEVGETLHGFDILDPTGKKIGLWYSILRAPTYVRIEENGRVVIGTPPIDLWQRPEDGGLHRRWR